MGKWIVSTLKITLIVSFSMWLGQIPMGKEQLGSLYIKQLKNLFSWGQKEIESTRVLANWDLPSSFAKLLPNKTTTPAPKSNSNSNSEGNTENQKKENKNEVDEEGVTSSDRESLLRLLQ